MNPILGSASAATAGVALKATRPPAAENKWRRVIMGSPIRQLVNCPARRGWFSKCRPRAGIAISDYNPHGLMIEYDKCGADIRGFTASSPKASTRSI
jgi:hypothetical protein